MDPKQLYTYALDVATKVVMQVRPNQLLLPTPDTEWNVHDLLQHVIYELAWTADIVEGKTIAQVGDQYDKNLLDGDPEDVWRDYAIVTRIAVQNADTDDVAHLSYSDKTVAEYLYEAGNDQLIHAWDLGQAIGTLVSFDDHVAKTLYDQVADRVDEFQSSGLFAPPVDVPESASIQTKLLAILGRSENWRQAAS